MEGEALASARGMRPPAGAGEPASERLALHRALWQTKPLLRAVYADFYRRLSALDSRLKPPLKSFRLLGAPERR